MTDFIEGFSVGAFVFLIVCSLSVAGHLWLILSKKVWRYLFGYKNYRDEVFKAVLKNAAIFIGVPSFFFSLWLLAFSLVIFLNFHGRLQAERWKQVRVGMTKDSVLKVMGEPDLRSYYGDSSYQYSFGFLESGRVDIRFDSTKQTIIVVDKWNIPD